MHFSTSSCREGEQEYITSPLLGTIYVSYVWLGRPKQVMEMSEMVGKVGPWQRDYELLKH